MATPRNNYEKLVERYLFTFQHEAGPNSLHPHVPSNDKNTKSGVTIGAGYDLGKFEHSEKGRQDAYQELSALGVDDRTAKSLSYAAGLKGHEAHEWAKSHQSIQITKDNQVNLYNKVIPQYEQKAKDILNYFANNPQYDVYPEDVKWESLSQEQKEIYYEYAYHGVLGKFPSFAEAVSKEDWSRAAVEYERSADGKPLVSRNNDFFNEYLLHNLQTENEAENARVAFGIEPLNSELGPFSVLEDTTYFDGKTLSNEFKEEISHDIKDRYFIDNFNLPTENNTHENESLNDVKEPYETVLPDNGDKFNEAQTVVIQPINNELFEPTSIENNSRNVILEDFGTHSFDDNTGVIIEHEPFIFAEEPIDFADSKFNPNDIINDFSNNQYHNDPTGLIIDSEPIVTDYEPVDYIDSKPLPTIDFVENNVFVPVVEEPIVPENTIWNTPFQPMDEPSILTQSSFESLPPNLFANNSIDVFSTQSQIDTNEVASPSVAGNDLWANDMTNQISTSPAWDTSANDSWKVETPEASPIINAWDTPTNDPWAVETTSIPPP